MSQPKWPVWIVGGILVASISVSESAHAQGKSDGVIRLEVTTIEGRVQKPTAFFINTRQSLVYETLEIKESFIKEIPAVVEDGEF